MKASITQRLRDWASTICMVRTSDVPNSKARLALEAADEIERTRVERDEARRALCIAMADDITSATEFAAQRGWDCFAEVRP